MKHEGWEAGMRSADLRFGMKDCFGVVGLMLVVVGLITFLFECLSWLQVGVWNLVSIATVMDHFGVLPVHAIHGEGELERNLESVMHVALDAPFSITMFLIGSLIAIVADHYMYVRIQTIDRRRAPLLRDGFDDAGHSE
jgi:hypothetical protein